MTNRNQKIVSFPDRAYDIADASIGESLTVRINHCKKCSGTIVVAEPDHWQNKGKFQKMVFRVVMECGINKTRKTFYVCDLPH